MSIETPLRAGYSEQEITPSLGVEMTGYGYYLERRATAVRDALKVRALALEHGAERLLLLSCDLLGFTIAFSDALRDAVAAATGLERRQVLLACTHTHTGPASQPLEGLGEVDMAYLATLRTAVVQAAQQSIGDLAPAEPQFGQQTIAPIGYNRHTSDFAPIDPGLRVIILRRADTKIYLLNYACHPVTYGRVSEISADWPGATAREIEARGHRALVFQGFCGDINPVAWKNKRWGTGEDVRCYGKLLSHQVYIAEEYAEPLTALRLQAVERRIRLPLHIPHREDIIAESQREQGENAANPAFRRFIAHWEQAALAGAEEARRDPYLDVPLQGMAIGELRLLALPGEVFCQYGLRLRERYPLLCTCGYANGNAGYYPTAAAYQVPGDYACQAAPRFYTLFPFAPQIEEVLMTESRQLLDALGAQPVSGRGESTCS